MNLLLQPNLFVDKDDFQITPLIVIRTTKKEKDFVDDKPTGGLTLGLDSFRLPWAGGSEETCVGIIIVIITIIAVIDIFVVVFIYCYLKIVFINE